MPMPTAQQAAQNWARGMSNASERIRQGVNAVTVNPAQKAIAAIPRMVDGIQRAAADGRIQRGLARVTLESWREDFLSKGMPRIAAGAQTAVPKMESFMAEFLPFVDNVVKAVNSEMPRGDIEVNLQRANQVARRLHEFRRSR
jgi:hypothetical protein